MKINLPLEVLSAMSPILALVEGWERRRFVRHKLDPSQDKLSQEERWLMGELPHYSRDSLQDMLRGGFVDPPKENWEKNRWREKVRGVDENAPIRFPFIDLIKTFHYLSSRYFHWYGDRLMIKKGRMLETHELGLRFPISHLLHYAHAFAVARNQLSLEKGLTLPDRLFELESNSRGFKALIDRGLSETHLHLNGVPNSDDVMVDHLVGYSQEMRNQPSRQFTILGRSLLKCMVLGILLHTDNKDPETLENLLPLLDRAFSEQSPLFFQKWRQRVDRRIQRAAAQLDSPANSHAIESEDRDLYLFIKPEWTWLVMNKSGAAKDRYLFEPRSKYGFFKKILLQAQIALIQSQEPTIAAWPDERSEAWKKPETVTPWHRFMNRIYLRFLVFHCFCWQRGTQHGPTTGLEQFKQFYDSPFRKGFQKPTLDQRYAIARRLGRFQALRHVEGRLGPPFGKGYDLLPWVLSLADQSLRGRIDKFGFIIHFIKNEPIWSPGPSTQNLTNLRYRPMHQSLRLNAERLYKMLQRPSPVQPFIVGIDAANLELAAPPEVFSPAFRFLREYPIDINTDESVVDRFKSYTALTGLMEKRRLFMTFHVGEDFRHLLSGLRAVHEAIEFLKPLPGDRLGHAIALALNPAIWMGLVGGVAIVSKLEWLDNLVWLRHLLGAGHPHLKALNIDDEIFRYSRDIYRGHDRDLKKNANPKKDPFEGQELTPEVLYDAWLLRQLDPLSFELKDLEERQLVLKRETRGTRVDNRWLMVQKKAALEVDHEIGFVSAYRLLYFYWYERKVRDEGAKTIAIDMENQKERWLKTMEEAQKKVKEMAVERQLVIEANPSSNRVIGYLESLEDHHIFPLTLNEDHELRKDLRVTIGTDNPGVCNSSIAHEYCLLGEVLLKRGVPEPKVVEWLEWLRCNGEDFNFLTDYHDFNSLKSRDVFEILIQKNARLYFRLKGKRAYHAYQKWIIYGRRQQFEDYLSRNAFLFLQPKAKKVVENFTNLISFYDS